MPIKIRSFGGPVTWVLRKYNTNFTSKVMLSFTARRYSRDINEMSLHRQVVGKGIWMEEIEPL